MIVVSAYQREKHACSQGKRKTEGEVNPYLSQIFPVCEEVGLCLICGTVTQNQSECDNISNKKAAGFCQTGLSGCSLEHSAPASVAVITFLGVNCQNIRQILTLSHATKNKEPGTNY